MKLPAAAVCRWEWRMLNKPASGEFAVWRLLPTGLLSILPERISGETEGNESMSLEQVTNADQPLTDDEGDVGPSAA